MFKSLIFGMLISLSCMTIAHEPLRLTGKKIEFAWDINDVLVKKNIPGMIKLFLADGGLKLIAKLGFSYVKYAFTGHVSDTQQFAFELRQLLKKNASAEEYKKIIEKYDPSFWHMAQKMAVEMNPNGKIEKLIKQLNAKGYVQRPASNIGNREFAQLQKKFPQLFGYFKPGLTVDSFTHEGSIPPKPEAAFFNGFQRLYNNNRDKIIIFIDDKQENVNAANKAGMIAIHFVSVKDLRKTLKKMGINGI